MATVSVQPETFTYVLFDHAALTAVVEQLCDLLSIGDAEVVVDVLEQIPFGRAELTSLDPITLSIESGALEDPLRPRKLSDAGAADIVGLLLVRARDLLRPGFDGPPVGEELDQPVQIAWDVHATARVARALAAAGDPIDGFRPQVQRRRYTFRTRHGFSDTADEQFERLWTADELTFPQIVEASERARATAAA